MNGVCAGSPGNVENLRNVEIRFGSRRSADRIGFVSSAHVEIGAVHLGVDDGRGNSHFVTRAKHADCDLATICD